MYARVMVCFFVVVVVTTGVAEEKTVEELADGILQRRLASCLRVEKADANDDVLLKELDANLYQAALESKDPKIKVVVAMEALKSMPQPSRADGIPWSENENEQRLKANPDYARLKARYFEIVKAKDPAVPEKSVVRRNPRVHVQGEDQATATSAVSVQTQTTNVCIDEETLIGYSRSLRSKGQHFCAVTFSRGIPSSMTGPLYLTAYRLEPDPEQRRGLIAGIIDMFGGEERWDSNSLRRCADMIPVLREGCLDIMPEVREDVLDFLSSRLPAEQRQSSLDYLETLSTNSDYDVRRDAAIAFEYMSTTNMERRDVLWNCSTWYMATEVKFFVDRKVSPYIGEPGETGKLFRARGWVLRSKENKTFLVGVDDGHYGVPTGVVADAWVPLLNVPTNIALLDGRPVEVVGRFRKTSGVWNMEIAEIRGLPVRYHEPPEFACPEVDVLRKRRYGEDKK